MNKIFFFLFALLLLNLAACTPAPLPVPATVMPTTAPSETPVPTPEVTVAEPTPLHRSYHHSGFGLSFQFPPSWFGPDETVSDQTLRVAVGSDVVHPYGQPPDQPSAERNTYQVVVQYSKNDSGAVWHETYQALSALKDGESISTARSLLIRLRQFTLGKFQGIEFISTLSETAQTQPVYIRQVILIDDQSNILTVMGTPDNVEVSQGGNWRDTYRQIDEANQENFHLIVGSLATE